MPEPQPRNEVAWIKDRADFPPTMEEIISRSLENYAKLRHKAIDPKEVDEFVAMEVIAPWYKTKEARQIMYSKYEEYVKKYDGETQ